VAYGDLLMVVPSRGRPGNIARLHKAMKKTCRAHTQLIVGLDADDPARDQYQPGENMMYVILPGLRQVGAWLNELAVGRDRHYPAIGHFGDDNVPSTVGWDERVLEALETTPFAFGNDLYPREPGSLPCHIFMRSQVIAALGYMAPPGIRHMVDLAWRDWGQACGITFLDKVIIEHLHWSTGKAEVDATYGDVNECLVPDNQAHRLYQATQLAEDVRKIKAIWG